MNIKKIIWLFIVILIISTNLIAGEEETPYLILISFDGFRWDYPQRGLTPNLEKMAQEGVSALSLQPVFPSKTFPNHYSIITGLYPINHGIIHNDFFDPFDKKRYKVGDTTSVRDSRWYQGEAFWETAERQGIITASCFWPGSELNLSYRRPSYFKYYEHKRPYERRIEDIINWLKLPQQKRPHFITLYFDATDSYGHKFGPDSPETNQAIRQLDHMLGLLESGLSDIHLLDKVNIVVVSDHGMTALDPKKVININQLLSGFTFDTQGNGPLMMIDCEKKLCETIYKKLKQQEDHFKVYTKNNVPKYFNFSKHPFISPIIVIADPGWSLVKGKLASFIYPHLSKGNHGYDNHHIDMHGIFYAKGPAFKKGYRTGTLWNIDIYPLLCKVFNIFPRNNIDGKLERIEFILK